MIRGYLAMTLSDMVRFSCIPIIFSLWLILAPRSVIRFYGWFHRMKLPLEPRRVRIAGAFALFLVVAITVLTALQII